MARIDTLKNFLTDIADKFRAVLGTTDAIPHSEYDTKIDEVYEVGKQAEYDRFWDNFQDNGNRKIYWYGFASPGWNQETLNPKHKIVIVDTVLNSQYAVGMFYRCGCELVGNKYIDFSKIADKFDFSKVQRATDTFNSAHMDNVVADLSSAVYTDRCFANTWDSGIRSLTLKLSELVESSSSMFSNPALAKVTMMEGSVMAKSYSFSLCPLDKESFISIVGNLSTITSGFTITFNKTAINSAFGIDIDDPTTYPEGSEFYELRHSRDNWTINYA